MNFQTYDFKKLEEDLINFEGKEMTAESLLKYVLESERYDVLNTLYLYLDLILSQSSNYILAIRNECIRLKNIFYDMQDDYNEFIELIE